MEHTTFHGTIAKHEVQTDIYTTLDKRCNRCKPNGRILQILNIGLSEIGVNVDTVHKIQVFADCGGPEGRSLLASGNCQLSIDARTYDSELYCNGSFSFQATTGNTEIKT